jgi:hypothetical protein
MRYYLPSDSSSEPEWHDCESLELEIQHHQEILSYELFAYEHQLIVWNPLLCVISIKWSERVVILFSVTEKGAQVILRQVTRAPFVLLPFITRRHLSNCYREL